MNAFTVGAYAGRNQKGGVRIFGLINYQLCGVHSDPEKKGILGFLMGLWQCVFFNKNTCYHPLSCCMYTAACILVSLVFGTASYVQPLILICFTLEICVYMCAF